MSSTSDSEDDCYGNIAQKLHKMKDKYTDDVIGTTDILNDSMETSTLSIDLTNNTVSSVQEFQDESQKVLERLLNEAEARRGRTTRSMRKRKTTVTQESEQQTMCNENNDSSCARNKSRGRGRDRLAAQSTPSSAQSNPSRGRRGARSRGRSTGGARSRGSSGRATVQSDLEVPTFSVGNTHEYEDQSENLELFRKVDNNSVISVEDCEPDDNEELSVKVYWQNLEYFRFTIRKYQKLSQMFEFFAHKNNVDKDKLLFTYNDRIITPNDTPDSINYNFVKFIDGGIIKQKIDVVSKEVGIKGGIKIKFQCENVKKPYETAINLDDKMSVAMLKCAEHLEMQLNNLIFEFDGDNISGRSTARELELEGGECIDVRIVR